jgi:hypothetical protein
VVLIDTVVMAGNSDVRNEHGEIVKSLHGSELPGPVNQQAAADQWAWIESTLANSTADYLIVGGHYPVYSICEHGPSSQLVQMLKPLMEKYNVTVYFAGHDHCAEHINIGTGPDYHGIGTRV